MNKAQDYFNQNLTDKTINRLELEEKTVGTKLTEDLIIQDYSSLEEIILKEHELTTLTINNCPKLSKINVRNNLLTKLALNDNNNTIEEIIANSNSLTDLDLNNCPNLKKLIIADNPDLDKIKGLNFQNIKHFNFANTSFSLEENYQVLKEDIDNLKKENEGYVKSLEIYDQAGFQKKLVLTEPIQTPKQAEEAIRRLLVQIEKSWRAYFESNDPDIVENSPNLGSYFQFPEHKRRGMKILDLVIQTQTSRDYEKLVREWNDGDAYNPEYDYGDNLYELMELLGHKKELQQK